MKPESIVILICAIIVGASKIMEMRGIFLISDDEKNKRLVYYMGKGMTQTEADRIIKKACKRPHNYYDGIAILAALIIAAMEFVRQCN